MIGLFHTGRDYCFSSLREKLLLAYFLLIAAVRPSLAVRCGYAKSVDVCICCRPTARGFSHCPIKVGRQRAEATLMYATAASTGVSRETSCRMTRNHISTGIYRCSILDFDMKFCENFRLSRISADKRFSNKMSADPPTLPVTGLLRCGLRDKVTHLFALGKQIFIGGHCRIWKLFVF